MSNSIRKCRLFICITVIGVIVITACSESNYQSEYVANEKAEFTAVNNESILAEYLVVLEENVDIVNATGILIKYEVEVIRDLRKGRYLIVLKNDPGIEQLKKAVEGSEHIKQIQPNYGYTIY